MKFGIAAWGALGICLVTSLVLLFLGEEHILSVGPMMTHIVLASLVIEMVFAAVGLYKVVCSTPIV